VLKRLYSPRAFPFVLLFFCIITYGLLIPSLGFYWDDWPMTWFGHVLGSKSYFDVLSSDRPFLGAIYILSTSILRLVPWQWQIFGLLTRWLTTLTVWWTLTKLWPDKTEIVVWISILFTVYPGFKQQPISVIYGNGLVLLAAFFLSLGFMIKAIRTPRRYWLFTILALVFYSFSVFSTEYYIGLDLIRPLIIWLVLKDQIQGLRKQLPKVLLNWIPYLAILGGFLIWRVFVFKFPTYQPMLLESTAASQKIKLLQLIDSILDNTIKAGWTAWISVIRAPITDDFAHTATILFWMIFVVATLIAFVYLIKFKPENPESQSDRTPSRSKWGRTLAIIGIFTLFVAGWPFWITDLPITLQFPYDRFTLAFILGSCFLVAGLLLWLIDTRLQRVILLSLIIGFSIAAQYQNSNTYRREWMTQENFFWQLMWRAPGLKPGTALVTTEIPLTYYSDNSLSAPLNWIYAPDFTGGPMPYFMVYINERFGTVLPDYKNNLPMRKDYRAFEFNSTTSQALVFKFATSGCLRIIDPKQPNLFPAMPARLDYAVSISHPNQIILDPEKPVSPPVEIFDSEPPHTWCYYFEKADLARQQGDWQKVVELGEQAFQKEFSPEDSLELLLYADGYAMTGDWQNALDLTWKVDEMSHQSYRPKLCLNLDWMQKNSPPPQNMHSGINDARDEFKCQPFKD
jgi:hypothetical protein